MSRAYSENIEHQLRDMVSPLLLNFWPCRVGLWGFGVYRAVLLTNTGQITRPRISHPCDMQAKQSTP